MWDMKGQAACCVVTRACQVSSSQGCLASEWKAPNSRCTAELKLSSASSIFHPAFTMPLQSAICNLHMAHLQKCRIRRFIRRLLRCWRIKYTCMSISGMCMKHTSLYALTTISDVRHFHSSHQSVAFLELRLPERLCLSAQPCP